MARAFKRLGIFLLLVCVAAGVLALTRESWLKWVGDRLIDSGPPCKADLIVVLAGDLSGFRIMHAAKLVRDGWAPKVLVSGAGTEYGENEGDMAIRYIVRQGFPVGEFFNFPSPAQSTAEEAQYVSRELRRLGIHRFILLTSNFHTRRAGGIYRKAVPDIPFCIVGAPYPDFTVEKWWHSREGQKALFFEWSKTISQVFGL